MSGNEKQSTITVDNNTPLSSNHRAVLGISKRNSDCLDCVVWLSYDSMGSTMNHPQCIRDNNKPNPTRDNTIRKTRNTTETWKHDRRHQRDTHPAQILMLPHNLPRLRVVPARRRERKTAPRQPSSRFCRVKPARRSYTYNRRSRAGFVLGEEG